jgi:sterol desaturase/sphingolipid hydroxylase (fatty acid hydroxylase superfamily)
MTTRSGPDGATVADYLTASPRLFENPLLDKLSRVHWTVPLYVYAPVIAVLAYLSFTKASVAAALGCMLLGYVAWTLTEYFGHRYLFHWEFPGEFGKRLHFLIHGVHHDHPSDPLRLVMPVLLSAPILLTAFAVIALIFGFPLAWPVLAGFTAGYLAYDMVHYHVHHREPTTRFGRMLRRVHMLHHFRDHDRGFGVSAPWWDYVFGTSCANESARGDRPK